MKDVSSSLVVLGVVLFFIGGYIEVPFQAEPCLPLSSLGCIEYPLNGIVTPIRIIGSGFVIFITGFAMKLKQKKEKSDNRVPKVKSESRAGQELFADKLREYYTEQELKELEKEEDVTKNVRSEPESIKEIDLKDGSWEELPRQYGISYQVVNDTDSGKEIIVERDGKKAVYFVSNNEVELRSPQAEETHGEGWVSKTTSLLRMHFT